MLTNNFNLPAPILRFAERKQYSKGDSRYSVTELLKPPRLGALQRLYKDAIVEDVADNLQSAFGTALHVMLRESGATEEGALLEERLYAEVLGVRVSGEVDLLLLYPDGRLDDYKTAMTYAVRYELKKEWEAQTNLYAWLETMNGRSVSHLRIIPFLKDWTVGEARRDRTGHYPKHAVLALDVPLWTFDEQQAYIEERVMLHKAADEWAAAPDKVEAPLCTDDERWIRNTRWALMKPNRKTAVMVTDWKAEADFLASSNVGYWVERRGGEPTRCLDYCSPGRAGFCKQWNEDKDSYINFNRPNREVDTSAFDESVGDSAE